MLPARWRLSPTLPGNLAATFSRSSCVSSDLPRVIVPTRMLDLPHFCPLVGQPGSGRCRARYLPFSSQPPHSIHPSRGSSSLGQDRGCRNASPETADRSLAVQFRQTPLRARWPWVDFSAATASAIPPERTARLSAGASCQTTVSADDSLPKETIMAGVFHQPPTWNRSTAPFAGVPECPLVHDAEGGPRDHRGVEAGVQ